MAEADEPAAGKLHWMVRTDRHVLVRMYGEDFTVAKFLQEELLALECVSFASCDVQDGSVVLCVRVTPDDTCPCAHDAVVQALTHMRAKCAAFSSMCADAVSGYTSTPGYGGNCNGYAGRRSSASATADK